MNSYGGVRDKCDVKLGDRVAVSLDPQSKAFLAPRVPTPTAHRLATVRFIGSLDGQQGIWYGIEYDDQTYGKHNGTYNGKRYFKTREPFGGSFVRSSKIVFHSRSFLSAFRDRYNHNKADLPARETLATNLNTSIETRVSWSRMKDLDAIQEVDLNSSMIDCERSPSTDDEDDIDHQENKENEFLLLNNLKTLCLQNNLFTSWDEVHKISVHSPNVQTLTLGGNKMELDPSKRNIVGSLNPSITSISLVNCDFHDWHLFSNCARDLFPHVQHLDLSMNPFSEIPPSLHSSFARLKTLNMSSVSSLRSILPFASLLSLEALIVDGCSVDRLGPVAHGGFPLLTYLSLNDNLVADWEQIDALNSGARNLKKLGIKRNPISAREEYDTTFNLIIARVASLQILNREDFKRDRRRDAELYYINRTIKEWKDSKKCNNSSPTSWEDFLRGHARLLELVRKFKMEDSLQLAIGGNGKPDLVSQQIRSHSDAEQSFDGSHNNSFNDKKKTVTVRVQLDGENRFEERVLLNVPIRTWLAMLRRKLQIPFTKKVTLLWKSGDQFQYPIEKLNQNVNFYSIEDGDVICVQTQ